MRIAVFYYIAFSGAKRVVKEHVSGLRSLGHKVDVYTYDNTNDIFSPQKVSDQNFLYSFKPLDINLPFIKRIKLDFFDTFYKLRFLHKKIAKDIDSKKYDIVLVHTDINTQAPYLLRYLKTKNVYFCLEPLRNGYEYSLRLKDEVGPIKKFYEDLNRWIRKRIDRKNTLSANNVLAISLFGRERIISAYDIYPKVSYLGVDEKVFKSIGIKKKKQGLFVAEREYIYGYDLMQEAVKLLPKSLDLDIKVIEWKKNDSERLSDEALVGEYNTSLFSLSLSRFDTFGLAPLESMACGVPVIALNVAGYRETIIDGQTGFLVDFDPRAIADAIIKMVKESKLREEMGARGRKKIENDWIWKTQIKNLEEILIRITRER